MIWDGFFSIWDPHLIISHYIYEIHIKFNLTTVILLLYLLQLNLLSLIVLALNIKINSQILPIF